jgi:hypothetical protein
MAALAPISVVWRQALLGRNFFRGASAMRDLAMGVSGALMLGLPIVAVVKWRGWPEWVWYAGMFISIFAGPPLLNALLVLAR